MIEKWGLAFRRHLAGEKEQAGIIQDMALAKMFIEEKGIRVLDLTQPANGKIVDSGRQGRAFLHVQDAVHAILLAMRRGLDQGPIQIGPDYCTSIRSIAEILVRISGKKIKIEYDKTKPEGDQARSADFRKARRCLGWAPRVNLTAGLRDLYRWIELKEGAQSRSSFKRQAKKQRA